MIFREKAKAIICERAVSQMDKSAKRDLLENMLPFDESMPQVEGHPWTSSDFPDTLPETFDDAIYLPALISSFCYTLAGVTNEYLSSELEKVLGEKIQVIGEFVPLLECPCCQFLTLHKRHSFHICKVCGWEDCNGDDPSGYNPVNRMSLIDAKLKFNGQFQEMVKRQPENLIKFPRSVDLV
jgi:Cysteine-rich CPCC